MPTSNPDISKPGGLEGSKQAAHKIPGAVIATLREKLEAMGFQGLDALGLVKSSCGVSPQAVLDASRFQSSPSRLKIFRLNRIQGVWESLG